MMRRINALAALLRCLCWFNPLVHIAAHLMRIDQELACDAAVVERHPRAKAVYATALLKAQLASRPLPLGCYWPAGTEHPLTERVEMLKQAAPTRMRRVAGASALVLLSIGAGLSAWAAMPPETHLVEALGDQPAPAPPPPKPMDFSAQPGFNANDQLEITGEVVRADTSDPNDPAPDLWVQATEIRRNGGPAEPNAKVWRINMAALRAGLERVLAGKDVGYAPPKNNPSQIGKRVTISGYSALKPVCVSDCLAQAIQIKLAPNLDQRTAAQDRNASSAPPSNSPQFDNVHLVILQGRITRIELGSPNSYIWMETQSVSRADGVAKQVKQTWRVKASAEPNAPNWARDHNTVGMAVEVRGYSGEETSCDPNCTINGTAIRQLSGYPMPGITFGSGFWLPPGPPLPDLPKTGPQPIRYEPQQTQQPLPAWNAPLVPEANMPIYLRGKVERIDFGDMRYVVFLRATSVIGGGGPGGHAEPNQALWELSPTTYFGDRDTLSADLMGKNVEVRGLNLNAACTPNCRIKVQDLIMPRTSEVPAPAAGASHVAEFARWYDTTKPAVVRGTVERIQFHDGMFDAWIRSETRGPVPGQLYQVRSEYRFPRADIERELLNKTVVASGWRARENINTHCEPVCGMYATEFEFPNKARLTPSGDPLNRGLALAPVVMRLVSDPMPDAPAAFRDLFDWNAPLTIEGRITKVESSGAKVSGPGDRNLADIIWVETTSVAPASTTGAKAGTMWRVVGGGLPAPVELFIGGKVTAFGYNAKDKSCQPTCMMAHVEMSVSR